MAITHILVQAQGTGAQQPSSGVPVITGTLVEGNTLTVDVSGISDPNGIESFGYQWNRDGVAIGGAVNSTYVLTSDDTSSEITVSVLVTDEYGDQQTLTSNPTAIIIPSSPALYDFNDNLMPKDFIVSNGTSGGTATVSNQQLVISATDLSGTEPSARWKFNAVGDFEIYWSVDLTGVNVTDFNNRVYGQMLLFIGADSYQLNFGDIGTQNTVNTYTSHPSQTTYGTSYNPGVEFINLGFKRIGTTVQTFYKVGTGSYTLLSSGTATTDNATNIVFRLSSAYTSGNHPDGNQTVRFDNINFISNSGFA